MMKIVVMFLLCCLVAACQSLGSRPAKVIESQRQNITTSRHLSASSQGIVVAVGFDQAECMAKFKTCVQAVQKGYFNRSPKARLATLAELYYAYAMHLKQSHACQIALQRQPIDAYYANAPLSDEVQAQKQSATNTCQTAHLDSLYQALKYSYAYVFYDNLTGETTITNLTDETTIRTQDIYHMAIYGLMGELYLQDRGSFALSESTPIQFEPTVSDPFVQISQLVSHLDKPTYLSLYLANDPYYLNNLDQADGIHILSDLTSIYDNRLPSLSVTSSRTGLGVGYVGSLGNRHQNRLTTPKLTQADPQSRIYPMGHLLMTAVIVPQGETLDEVLQTHAFDLFILNPYKSSTISVLGREYPLFANFSAGYAKWLADNAFRELALVQMLDDTHAHLPELYLLEPYHPDKKVIIMLHGLASSPKTWVDLTNSLLADPTLRNNYQVWQVFYATNLPMLENRYQIQKLIETAFDQFDPNHSHKASHNATIIGHSMGAVIGRLMLSDDNLNISLENLDKFDKRLLDGLDKDARNAFDDRSKLSALPQVDTAVFVSAPFRGTDYADRWFTRGLRRVIRLPVGLTQAVNDAFKSDTDANFIGTLFLQNGASQLSNKSDFMRLTQNVSINKAVRYHSIMANNTGDTADINSAISQHISDGIVPYASSHLDGAVSEIIIDGGHGIHENPKTVLHLRQILHDKLAGGQIIIR